MWIGHLDTIILNLDVVKAFDKMKPQIIYKLRGQREFFSSYKILGSIWTSDTGMNLKIAIWKSKFLAQVHLSKDMLQSRHV